MFKDHRDEERLCQTLKAYVEEWGPEYVYVALPRHWKDLTPNLMVGKVRIEFSTFNSISIHVQYERTKLNYTVNLAEREPL